MSSGGNLHCIWMPRMFRIANPLPAVNAAYMRKTVYTEIAYIFALTTLAFGTALMVYGDFGMSMVLSPAYIVHLYFSQFWPFFSFAAAEYVLQAILLLTLILIMGKAKISYLLSFGATVFYGIVLDGAIKMTALLPANLYLRIAVYVVGGVICCGSLALLFSSYLPPAAYELFSKEISSKTRKPVHMIVNYYNIGSLLLGVVLSLAFFGKLRGIGIGTVICTVVYGTLIRLFQVFYNKQFQFQDRFPWRKQFED